jgi:hypothetical protein
MKTHLALATVLALAACGSDEPTTESTTITETGTAALADVCPSTIVFQTDWFPQGEHGGLYELLGDDYVVSKDRGTTSGTMVLDGEDLGVDVEVRAGGPFIQSPVVTQMYQDDAITMGYVGNDVAVARYADAPTVAVFNALNVNPQVVLWDKARHPEAETLEKVVPEVDAVYVFGEPSWVKYLVGQGKLDQSKVDSNYQGNLILATENVAHQGFLTSEPFLYRNLDSGAIETGSVLIHDLGWTSYPQNLAVRKDRLEELSPCLEQLVPVLQRAQLNYLAAPERANAIIVDAVTTFDSYWQQSAESTAYSASTQLSAGIIGNGDTPTFGDLEEARVTDFIAKVTPILRESGIEVPDVTAADIVDNSFLDPEISFGN